MFPPPGQALHMQGYEDQALKAAKQAKARAPNSASIQRLIVDIEKWAGVGRDGC